MTSTSIMREDEGIDSCESEIPQQQSQEGWSRSGRKPERREKQQLRRHNAVDQRDRPAGERPLALSAVATILLQVHQIVGDQ
jgi:hypothetical protein